MSCQPARTLLLEGELTDPEVVAHVRDCRDCARILEVLTAREAELGAAVDAVVHEDPAAAVRRARREPVVLPLPRRSSMFNKLTVGVALAAASVLVTLQVSGVFGAPPTLVTESESDWLEQVAALEQTRPTDAAGWSALHERAALLLGEVSREGGHLDLVIRLHALQGWATERGGLSGPQFESEAAWGTGPRGYQMAAVFAAPLVDTGRDILEQLPESYRPLVAVHVAVALHEDDAMAGGERLLDVASALPWNALSEAHWAQVAAMERYYAVALPDSWLRFQLLVETGRAAENANHPIAPFYRSVGDRPVNYYWYAAGVAAPGTSGVAGTGGGGEPPSGHRLLRRADRPGSTPASGRSDRLRRQRAFRVLRRPKRPRLRTLPRSGTASSSGRLSILRARFFGASRSAGSVGLPYVPTNRGFSPSFP